MIAAYAPCMLNQILPLVAEQQYVGDLYRLYSALLTVYLLGLL